MRLIPAVLLGLLALAVARPAAAIEYEIFVDVDTEEDLFDLLEQQQIDEEAFDQLLQLLRDGIDLNTATRDRLYELPNLSYEQVDAIIQYRTLTGRIVDPVDLVAAGILSPDELRAVAPFVLVGELSPAPYAVDGFVRVPLLLVPPLDDAPPAALEARVKTFKYFTAGLVLVLTHDQLGEVTYDPQRQALRAEGYGPRVKLPKIYLAYERDGVAAILGNFRIGFGQRLTFDNSLRAVPNGFVADDDLLRATGLTKACKESAGELGESPCAGEAGNEYTAPDFRWRQGLFGAAVSLKLPVGFGELQLHAFGSAASRPIYQYELYDQRSCPDPTVDDDPSCAAPFVYRRQDDPGAPTSRFSFSTLPDVFVEYTAGANVSFFTGPRSHVGATGYVSTIDWKIDDIELDFQEYSRYPRGGVFGAAGVDGHFRLRELDLFAEAAHSFDGTPEDQGGGGDFAAIVGGTWTFARKQVLEVSGRYYGEAFANPYARPIAAADEFNGQRARNEAGGRVRYSGEWNKRASLRAQLDTWTTVDDDTTPRMLAYLRADWMASREGGLGVWLQYQDKDLSRDGGDDACFEIATEENAEGEPISCSGEKVQASFRTHLFPVKSVRLATQFTMSVLDDPSSRLLDNKRTDLSAWLTASWAIDQHWRLRTRVRYMDEGINDSDYLETSLWAYAELNYTLPKQWQARLRYDVYAYLDDRDSTEARSPNPEQWFWLEATVKF
jgi:hypothetical protein